MGQFTLTARDLEMELWLRKRERDELIWTTRDGTKIPLRKMTDEHIKNCLNCMERANAYEEAYFTFMGEHEDAGDRL